MLMHYSRSYEKYTAGRWAIPESSRTNADDGLSLDPLGSVEGGNSIVEGSDVADVCLQMPMPVIQRVRLSTVADSQYGVTGADALIVG
jgi:hypothetical protein